MYKYQEALKKEGFANTNCPRLAKAIDELHSAIAKMDSKNFQLLKEKTLAQRLLDFAKCEELYQFALDETLEPQYK